MNLNALLAHLETTQLLRRLEDPDLAYMFKHVLTQETAYESLLLKKRREIHRHVAQYYEQLCGDALDEYAELLAHHYIEAGDDAKTLQYATLAGEIAERRYAQTEAIEHYSHALEAARQTEASSDQLVHLYTRRGRVLELSGRYVEALANYDEMEKLAHERGDRALELAALMARATIRSTPTPMLDAAQAQVLSDRALALARELGDRKAEARILWNLLLLNLFTGRPGEAVAFGEQSLAIARELDLREQLAFTLNDLYQAYGSSGQIELAWSALAEARQLWRELGNLPMLADNLSGSAMFHFMAGEYDRVIKLSDEALQISRSIGNLWGQSYSRMILGFIYLEYGQPDQAIEVMGDCIRLAEQAGFVVPQVSVRAGLGLVYGSLGAIQRGLELARLALAKAEAQYPIGRPEAMATLAQLYLLNGDLPEAEAALKEGGVSLYSEQFLDPTPAFALRAEGELALARRDYARAISVTDGFIATFHKFGIRPFLSDALYFKGKALLGLGQVEAAREALQAARAEAEALGSRRSLWEILFALSQIEAQLGNLPETEDLRRQAREVVEYIADHAGTPELHASFLNLPPVRAVLETRP